ncbi:MAG: DUF2793 domain-containing protein [Erythrobacter sp.]|jgi:hypothetical protein|nr:DUF2793 domain-containing protein [Erythrobacter sp.]
MAQSFNAAGKTAKFAFPFLFPGQAQKEFFVNQSLAMLDSLLQISITASMDEPPPEPVEGEAYRVLAPASGDWSAHEGCIALFVGGEWIFVAPFDGMRIFDRAAGQTIFFQTQWRSATPPSIPTGGVTIDQEARTALAEVVGILRGAGLIPLAAE